MIIHQTLVDNQDQPPTPSAPRTEWVFSQNGLGVEVGLFDAISEPVLTVFYRRYVELIRSARGGLAFSVGPELICMTNLSSLGSPWPSVLGAAGASIGIDWTFLMRFSLALELHGFCGVDLVAGGPGEPGLSPSLSARILL